MAAHGSATAAATGIPPLSLSTGPSGADGIASGSSAGTTGDFFFGARQNPVVDVGALVLPYLVIGGVILWALRR